MPRLPEALGTPDRLGAVAPDASRILSHCERASQARRRSASRDAGGGRDKIEIGLADPIYRGTAARHFSAGARSESARKPLHRRADLARIVMRDEPRGIGRDGAERVGGAERFR